MKTVIVLALAVAAVMACGSDNSTGPSVANVAGDWSFTTGTLTGTTTCTGTVDVQFTQSGSSLGGSLPNNGLLLSCNAGHEVIQCTGVNNVSGNVSGETVTFDLNDGCATGSGTLSNNNTAIAGTMTVISGSDTVSGSYTGTKT